MSNEQRKAFFAIFIGFILVASAILYFSGFIDFGEKWFLPVLLVAYSLCGVLIYCWIKKNPEEIAKWYRP